MNTSIYDKTAKGKEEIATRKYQLAPRLRTLLVLIDGHRSEDELLRNVAGLGLTADALDQLLTQQFVVPAASYATLTEPRVPAPPVAPPLAAPAPPPRPIAQFQSIYDFYNKTIKSNIGLRGFTLQLKVEKAGSVEELRALRDPYMTALHKAKGADVATALARQLDVLFGEVPA
jgi:hypothetical protein